MSAIKVVGEDKKEFKIELAKDTNSGLLNGEEFSWDVIKIKGSSYHIIKDNQSYNLEVLNVNSAEKSFFIKVDGIKYKFNAKDKYDELLHSLGMDNLVSTKVSDLKAPMPGLVLEVSVEGGQQVSKGDALLILEAMKMENAIVSPKDTTIKDVYTTVGETVDKNKLLIDFQ